MKNLKNLILIFHPQSFMLFFYKFKVFVSDYLYVLKKGINTSNQIKRLIWNNVIITEPERLSVGENARISKNVKIITPMLNKNDIARFIIGKHVFIGEGVELGLTPGAILRIGDYTTMHSGTVILGNVKIGRNCILSYNIFLATGNHVITQAPTWLIRDQDDEFGEKHTIEELTIDDDVWIGWGVFVRSGIHIGRGAIIGANSVITTDMEPYTIYAGTPARKIGNRLKFTPPIKVCAQSDSDLPYFYSGFLDNQESLKNSRNKGLIWTENNSTIILAKKPRGQLIISGQNCGKLLINMTIRLNGETHWSSDIEIGDFLLNIPFDEGFLPSSVPFNRICPDCIEINITHNATENMYMGIRTVIIEEINA